MDAQAMGPSAFMDWKIVLLAKVLSSGPVRRYIDRHTDVVL
jgi:hypothetical protein